MERLWASSIRSMIVIAIVVVCFSVSLSSIATAQDRGGLSELLERLNTRVEQVNGFTFSIVLADPPNAIFLEAEIGTEDGFEISEIGTDYVCVNRLAGAALTVTCIPYSNIGGIGYLDN